MDAVDRNDIYAHHSSESPESRAAPDAAHPRSHRLPAAVSRVQFPQPCHKPPRADGSPRVSEWAYVVSRCLRNKRETSAVIEASLPPHPLRSHLHPTSVCRRQRWQRHGGRRASPRNPRRKRPQCPHASPRRRGPPGTRLVPPRRRCVFATWPFFVLHCMYVYSFILFLNILRYR